MIKSRFQRLWSGEATSFAVLFALLTALCGLPLLLLFHVGLTDETGLTLVRITEALESRSVRRALWHSLESAFLSALLATAIGTLLALTIGLTDLRRKGIIIFLILLPMMIPPHVTAIAWTQAMGPGSPILQWLGIAPEIGSTHPLYSREGLVLVLAVQHMPLVFLLVRANLRAFPRELSDAARTSGASPLRMMRTVMLPLTAPTMLAGFILAFVAALGNFGINALLGIPARYTTLPVLIWRRLSSFGPDVLADMAVIAVILATITIAILAVQFVLQRNMRNALIGAPQAPLHYRLGMTRGWVESGLWLFIALTLGLPLASLLGTALVKTYGIGLSPETVTLENFREILFAQNVTLRAFVNSTLLAVSAALFIAAAAIMTGYALVLRRGTARRAAMTLAGQSEIAFAVPGIVISVAFILLFIKPLPLVNVSLYGTSMIIMLAYIAAFTAIGLKPVTAAYLQMDGSLEDAARISGAGYLRRMRRIFAPLVAPAAASGAILVFLTAYNEVTVSALLWSSGNETIGTVIFNYEDGGYTTLAAAMSAVVVAATIAIMFVMNRLADHVPHGTIPWRD